MPQMQRAFSEQLRKAISDSGLSRYTISVRTGIDQGTLSKFMKGERGLSLSAIDKLMAVLSLDIKLNKRKEGN